MFRNAEWSWNTKYDCTAHVIGNLLVSSTRTSGICMTVLMVHSNEAICRPDISNPSHIPFQTLGVYHKIGEDLSEVPGPPSAYKDVDDTAKVLRRLDGRALCS